MADDTPDIPPERNRAATHAGRKHPPVRDITDLLVFRLARLVGVHQRSGGNWAQEHFGLSLNEWRVLGLAHALEPVRTGRIADELMMDKGQLSRVVRSLVDRGYARTRVDMEDARASLLELTEAGLAAHDRLLAFAAERNEMVVETLTREEVETLMSLVGRMIDHNSEMLADEHGRAS